MRDRSRRDVAAAMRLSRLQRSSISRRSVCDRSRRTLRLRRCSRGGKRNGKARTQFYFRLIVSFLCCADCGLIAHRTCSATGLPSNCISAGTDNRISTSGKSRCPHRALVGGVEGFTKRGTPPVNPPFFSVYSRLRLLAMDRTRKDREAPEITEQERGGKERDTEMWKKTDRLRQKHAR